MNNPNTTVYPDTQPLSHLVDLRLWLVTISPFLLVACNPGRDSVEQEELGAPARQAVLCGCSAIDGSDASHDDGVCDVVDDSEACTDGLVMVSSGQGMVCALTRSQEVKCWGHNDRGQLGQGHTSSIGDDEFPSTIDTIDLGGPAVQIRTNGEQTYALLETGVVRAWGVNSASQLGLGHSDDIGDNETPAASPVAVDVPLGGRVEQLEVGLGFACARLQDGSVRCWGANDSGQLGQGHTDRIGDDEAPRDGTVVDSSGPAVDLAVGAYHACMVLDTGDVRCWGSGEDGRLGYGSTDAIGDDESPGAAGSIALGGAAVDVVAGGHHTCALLESGAVRCWGDGARGQLGYGSTDDVGDDEWPEAAGDVPLGGPVVALAAGWQHTCAVLSEGRLRCWGHAAHGQLGLGHVEDVGDDETPASIGDVDLGSVSVTSVFIGSTASTTCVLHDGGGLRCWGRNDAGQLGCAHTEPLGGTDSSEPGQLADIIVVDTSED